MKPNRNSKEGFSLVEVMVAMTISVFLLASAYATIFSLAKGSESMVNFSEMNTQSRNALELFGRDMRMAEDVLQDDWNSNSVVIQRRLMDGTPLFVRYVFVVATANTGGHFRRQEWSQYPGNAGTHLINDRVILYDVDELDMNYYRYKRDEVALNPLETKHIQLEAKLQREVLGITNTNYIISARFMMRNKDVTNQ
jgi:prepilin-type N-terminal cleavage/methylation domain-containing protein